MTFAELVTNPVTPTKGFQLIAVRSRCRVGIVEDAVMNESAATAWIIERLEIENTKMEEEMGTMDACEEDSTGGHSGAFFISGVLQLLIECRPCIHTRPDVCHLEGVCTQGVIF